MCEILHVNRSQTQPTNAVKISYELKIRNIEMLQIFEVNQTNLT